MKNYEIKRSCLLNRMDTHYSPWAYYPMGFKLKRMRELA
jgi:hypothetical protein